jgi:hypothetical protein
VNCQEPGIGVDIRCSGVGCAFAVERRDDDIAIAIDAIDGDRAEFVFRGGERAPNGFNIISTTSCFPTVVPDTSVSDDGPTDVVRKNIRDVAGPVFNPFRAFPMRSLLGIVTSAFPDADAGCTRDKPTREAPAVFIMARRV